MEDFGRQRSWRIWHIERETIFGSGTQGSNLSEFSKKG